jgi:hypothetical protein
MQEEGGFGRLFLAGRSCRPFLPATSRIKLTAIIVVSCTPALARRCILAACGTPLAMAAPSVPLDGNAVQSWAHEATGRAPASAGVQASKKRNR